MRLKRGVAPRLRPSALAAGLVSAFFAVCTFSPPAAASGTDIYIAMDAAGAATGTDCADAYAASFFNDPSHWGSAASQIGPGTTVHLCGTFTAPAGASGYLATQGSGSSGSPITILFESGAVLTATYWGGAAILVQNDFITVNGGTNGTIQATDNGTTKANQQAGGTGVQLSGASNVVIENLTIANLYVRSGMTDANGYCGALSASGGSNIQWRNNTAHDVHWALVYDATGGTTTNVEIGPGNDIYDTDHGAVIAIGNGTTATITGAYIHGNHIHDFANWDDTSDDFHHDGVHVFDFANDLMTEVYVYNNLIDGDWGMYDNAGIYVESADEGGTITTCGIFNNVFNQMGGANASGAIADYSSNGCLQANNTVFLDAMTSEFQTSIGSVIYNNVGIMQSRLIEGGDGGKISASDYNDFYPAPIAGSNSFIAPGGVCCIDTLADWTKATGFDMHSITANPNLTSAFVPSAGSPVIGAGKNLYGTCKGQPSPGLGALCEDAAGIARPASGGWDMGAYQYCTGKGCTPVTADGGTEDSGAVDGASKGDGGVMPKTDSGSAPDAARSGSDAGSEPGPRTPSGSGGCGCRATGAGDGAAGWGGVLGMGLALLTVGRHRRRSTRRKPDGASSAM
jgi:hypothetical protein